MPDAHPLDVHDLLAGIRAAAVVLPVLLAALAWWARAHFATRRDLDGVGSRISALETVALAARDQADALRDEVRVLDERSRQHWDRTVETVERVSRTMEAISREQREIATQQAAMARDLKHLLARLRD